MSRIKSCFTSRFEGGVIIEADVSQLEIVAAAYLSQDPVLIADIINGLDLHLVSLSVWQNKTYLEVKDLYDTGDKGTILGRRKAKTLSFQLQYGSGPTNMAREAGVTVTQAKRFIANYYLRYARLKEWQESNIELVKAHGTHTGRRTNTGLPARTCVLSSPTGRVYTYHEQDSPEWMTKKGIVTSFSPTTIKNYPVQGFATGDLFQLLLGKMFRTIRSARDAKELLLLVNTVHDSILFDYNEKSDAVRGAEWVSGWIKRQMEEITGDLVTTFGIDIAPLEIKVGVQWGPNWNELTNKLP